MTPAPIALFAYNRPVHIRRTIEALQANCMASQSDLIVFSDGPKTKSDRQDVAEVRKALDAAGGFRSVQVRKQDNNLGLARAVISGVTETVHRFGRVIVVEDDLVTSPFFLRYMNEALQKYEKEEKVSCIHGYFYPVEQGERLPETFFLKGADCWGWATWKRGWDLFCPDGKKLLREIHSKQLEKEFNFNGCFDFLAMLKDQTMGKNDSWAIRWHASVFLHGGLTLYPRRSLVHNIGNDSSGTHSRTTDSFRVRPAHAPVRLDDIPIIHCPAAQTAVEAFFKTLRQPMIRRMGHRLTEWLSGITKRPPFGSISQNTDE